ncbi:hypothetical protein [Phyllobacterium chamaecytisi]|uniref:hypothetical protein n=1 Tax=Phyllobacterium chamaecytisi TaxID=2876082 RepID=UPI001CCAC113|nr:hypothetical protein [Phyllobacterium sp. KW56]MBZ9600692.1 hypothetical protein [Phyllobacterium sp. KW56]
MTDRPTLFSAPMVRALLDGRKFQTRRIIKAPKWSTGVLDMELGDDGIYAIASNTGCLAKVPVRFEIGDRLWVKETHALVGDNEDDIHACPDLRRHVYYRADSVQPEALRWRPSLFMRRIVSRLTLIVTDVRIERLQDCSEADALAEGIACENVIIGAHCAGGVHVEETAHRYFYDGCDDEGFKTASDAYFALWGNINGASAADANPWVVAVSFDVIKQNIDEVAA